MRRAFGYLVWLVVAAVVLSGFGLAGARFAASSREMSTPREAAGANALFADIEGGALHYGEWGPKDGRPIVLIAGTLAWSETFRDIAAPLAAAGWRVLAPDLPPFGYSERPAGHDYSRRAQARRILDFADALQLKTFVLGVHSYGGGAAIEAALTASARIEKLVLLDVALDLGRTAEPAMPMASLLGSEQLRDIVVAATLTNPLVTWLGLRDFVADTSVVTSERVAIYTAPFSVIGTTDAIGNWLSTGLYRDERNSRAAEPAHYREFQPPVLVVWGREDSVTPLAQGEQIASLFPHATLEVLDGVNHLPHVEKPAEVVAAMLAFLAGDNGSPAAADKKPRLGTTAAP